MAKRKKPALTARNRAPKPKGKIIRRAAFQLTEVERDGEVSVDIEALDSQVRDSGRMAMFDNVFYMIKYHIESQCEDLAEAIGNALKLRDKRGDEMAEIVGENITLKRRCAELEAEIKKVSRSLQVGTLAPYAASKQLKSILTN